MKLANQDFKRLSSFIYSELGIKLPDSKNTMLESRLAKRLRVLGMSSYSDYCDYVFSDQGQQDELIHLFDVVTTNKTDFFREPTHFDFLTRTALPEIINSNARGGRKKLKVWSAGCSTGEEPYTLGMVLSDYALATRNFGFEILATDISTRVLEMARRAVYARDRIDPIPADVRKKYLLKSRDKKSDLVRICPELRTRVCFGRLNFMDREFGLQEVMDIIFCRNVLIYFDRNTQETLLRKFCRHLMPGGFVFLGHSESIHGYDLPLVQVAPTVYRKAG